jgi:hypothetical protein
MGRTCSTHGGMRNASENLVEYMKGRDHLGDLRIRGRIIYEGVSKSFRTGRLERELKVVHLSATRCICIVIL